MQNIFTTVLTPFIIAIAKGVLHSLAQAVWDSLRLTLIEAVSEVEKKFRNGDYSKQKKGQVVKAVIEYIQKHKNLSKVQLWALRVFISRVIDKMIDDLNKNYGHSWGEHVNNMMNYWAKRLPLID